MLQGARQPSVTYRQPLDADESENALGPQSSVGSRGSSPDRAPEHGTRTGGGGASELESSLTAGSWRQQKTLLGGAEFSMIPIDDRDAEDEDGDEDEDALRPSSLECDEDQDQEQDQQEGPLDSPSYQAVLPSPSAVEHSEHKHAAVKPADRPCHTFTRLHSLTVHHDECECAEAGEDSTLVTVHSAEQLPSVAALNPSDPASFETDSPEISLHVHSHSHTLMHADEDSEQEPQIIASSIDPAFVVARTSPQYLSPDYWEDSEGPYPPGEHVVPRAPMITCTCAVPWRSMQHLWTKHVQPESHARNITFEGHAYPAWRGQFYPVRNRNSKCKMQSKQTQPHCEATVHCTSRSDSLLTLSLFALLRLVSLRVVCHCV